MKDPKTKNMRVETKAEFLKKFEALDRRGDGYVDASELLEILTTLGDTLTVEEARRLVAMAPMTTDNQIDLNLFADTLLRN